MDLLIQWSELALRDRREIFSFWNQHNKSNQYSKRLQVLIKLSLEILRENPEIGPKLEIGETRYVMIERHFKLIYTVRGNRIFILRFWDTRQDPSNLNTPAP